MHINLTIISNVHTILFLRTAMVRKKVAVYDVSHICVYQRNACFYNHNMIILGYNTLYILNLF